jgi:hypothetical protein
MCTRLVDDTSMCIRLVDDTSMCIRLVDDTSMCTRLVDDTSMRIRLVDDTSMRIRLVDDTSMCIRLVDDTSMCIRLVDDTSMCIRLVDDTSMHARTHPGTHSHDARAGPQTAPPRAHPRAWAWRAAVSSDTTRSPTMAIMASPAGGGATPGSICGNDSTSVAASFLRHLRLRSARRPRNSVRADGMQLYCRPGTAVKLLWPAVNQAFGRGGIGDLGPI